jgi:hypothetical protein
VMAAARLTRYGPIIQIAHAAGPVGHTSMSQNPPI